MEIVEVLLGLGAALLEGAEVCGCFVQLVAGVVDLSTVFAGVGAAKETKKRRRLRQEGVEPQGHNTKLTAFWLLLPFALIVTGLALYTIVRALR